jgi:hypothetical protein
MSGWKFVAEFRRGRKDPILLACLVAVSDLDQAQRIAATKLVGADEITAEEISNAELKRLNIKNGEAVFL